MTNIAVHFVMEHSDPYDTPVKRLLSCYDYIVYCCVFKRGGNKVKLKDLSLYAGEVLVMDRGNCFRVAAAVVYCARVLGFDGRVVAGSAVPKKIRHGWSEIRIGNTWYLLDVFRSRWNPEQNFRLVTFEEYPKKICRNKGWEMLVKKGKVKWKKIRADEF